jgi:hypothetical protein
VDCHAFEFMQRALQDLRKTAYSLDARVSVHGAGSPAGRFRASRMWSQDPRSCTAVHGGGVGGEGRGRLTYGHPPTPSAVGLAPTKASQAVCPVTCCS